MAVSYTHLDVYKRQLLLPVRQERDAGLRPLEGVEPAGELRRGAVTVPEAARRACDGVTELKARNQLEAPRTDGALRFCALASAFTVNTAP